jgi:hypothetical protein
MARMPRGEPRSVPDVAGDQYDAMMREERWKRLTADAAGGKLSFASDEASLRPSESLSDRMKRAPRPEPTVTIGGRTYRAVDNGRANVLVPVSDPQVSAAQLAERRRAVSRVAFMADSPLGSAAYDLATAMNTSPQVRDGALVAGGLADAAMSGGAFRSPPARNSPPPQRAQAAPPTLPRSSIRLRELNEKGQARGVTSTITEPMLGTGTEASQRLRPPGWQGNGRDFNEARGHLLANSLGGSGEDMRNLVTLTQNPANSPYMRDFEGRVAQRVRDGEVIEYSALPIYRDGVLPPSSVLLTAYGSRGAPIARLVQNPAGRGR